MAQARYFVEVKKFTSLRGSELPTDADYTSRKLAERTFFGEAKHHINDPNTLVLLCQRADYVQRVLAAKYRPDKHVTLEPAFFGL
jgi:hypothetical protein